MYITLIWNNVINNLLSHIYVCVCVHTCMHVCVHVCVSVARAHMSVCEYICGMMDVQFYMQKEKWKISIPTHLVHW